MEPRQRRWSLGSFIKEFLRVIRRFIDELTPIGASLTTLYETSKPWLKPTVLVSLAVLKGGFFEQILLGIVE